MLWLGWQHLDCDIISQITSHLWRYKMQLPIIGNCLLLAIVHYLAITDHLAITQLSHIIALPMQPRGIITAR